MSKNIRICVITGAVSALSFNALADETTTPAVDATTTVAAPASPVLNCPGMNFPLAGNANPLGFDAGPIGKVYVSGAVSALGFIQSHASVAADGAHNKSSIGDFSNAQVILQKVDGPLQFFIEGGGYSIPTLGVGYLRASKQTSDSFGVIPTAYLKWAPNDAFNVIAGKLPTIIGVEYTFTFENTNIQRGLLWNQENVFTRGVQANYNKGSWAASASVTDGFYSGRYNWLTGLVSYTINDSNTITFVAGGNVGNTKASDFDVYTTPLPQNDSQIYNLIYKYTKGPLTLQPYLQYTRVPSESASQGLGWTQSASTYGAALLVNYALNSNFNLGGRVEYIGSSGSAGDTAKPNLLGYGIGSDAWSLTITPTYQNKAFFARGEASFVKLSSMTSGLGFGKSGTDDSQSRVMLETGFLF